MQLSSEAFREIIGQLRGNAKETDKRSKPRVGVRNRVKLRLLGTHAGQPIKEIEVTVRDLSADGIGLLHHERLPVKSLFGIGLPVYGQRDLMAVYKVRHCDPLDAQLFRIGGVLVKIDDPEGLLKMIDPPAEEAAPPNDTTHATDVIPPTNPAHPSEPPVAAR
jgi:hypothetical protein